MANFLAEDSPKTVDPGLAGRPKMTIFLPLTRSATWKVFGPSEQPAVSVSMNSDRVPSGRRSPIWMVMGVLLQCFENLAIIADVEGVCREGFCRVGRSPARAFSQCERDGKSTVS
jgi:hypothetical protein